MPHLRALVQRMQGRPFSLFAVNSYDEEPVFRQKSEEMGVTWPVLYQGEATPIADLYRVRGYPTIYVNPPYGSDPARGTRILHWFTRMADAAQAGSSVIALVPVATNTAHWKRCVYPLAKSICFLYEPRVRFFIGGVEDPKGAPMSCAVIYWGDDPNAFSDAFRDHGAVVSLEGVALPEGQPTLL